MKKLPIYFLFFVLQFIFSHPAYTSALGEQVKFIEIDAYIDGHYSEADTLINDGIVHDAYFFGLKALYVLLCEDPRDSGRSPFMSADLIVFPIDENPRLDDYLKYIQSSRSMNIMRMTVFEEDPLHIKLVIETYADKSKTSSGKGKVTLQTYEEFNDFMKEIDSLEGNKNHNIAFAEKILTPQAFHDFNNALNNSDFIDYTFEIMVNTQLPMLLEHEIDID